MDKNSTKLLYGIINRPSPQVLRLLRGFTPQAALSDKLGVAQNTISDWETGRSTPSPGNLFDLVSHYMAWTSKLNWPGLDLLICAEQDAQESALTPSDPEES